MKYSSKTFGSVLLAATMAFTAFAGSPAVAETETQQGLSTSPHSEFSEYTEGQIEVLDAVIFGQGDLSKEAGIQSIDFSGFENEYYEIRRNLYSENIDLLKDSADKISSGNVNTVHSGMDDLTEHLVSISKSDLNNNGSEPMVCTPVTGCAIGWYLYAGVVVHNTVAVTALAAVAAANWTWCGITNKQCKAALENSGIQSSEMSRVEQEMTVRKLTKTFSNAD